MVFNDGSGDVEDDETDFVHEAILAIRDSLNMANTTSECAREILRFAQDDFLFKGGQPALPPNHAGD